MMPLLKPVLPNPASQLDVLGHDGYSLGVDGAQVRIFEEANKYASLASCSAMTAELWIAVLF